MWGVGSRHLCGELRATPLAPLLDCVRRGVFVKGFRNGGSPWSRGGFAGTASSIGSVALQTELEFVKQALFRKHLMSILQCWLVCDSTERGPDLHSRNWRRWLTATLRHDTGNQLWCGEGCRSRVCSIVYCFLYLNILRYLKKKYF